MTGYQPPAWGFVGVVHLPAMPGDPLYDGGGFAKVERMAMADAEALVAGGVDRLILENFGSPPFPKGTEGQRLPPHQVATLALLGRRCADRLGLPVGVNCLRNDAIAAVGIAAAAGLEFVRINVHTGAYVTDQGLIEGEAHHTLRYRQALGATGAVKILADVLVKHAAPLAPIKAAAATRDCVKRGLADGVIVTGEATGSALPRARLEVVAAAASGRAVLIGSGLTPELAAQLAPLADGAIVGTWIKHDGDVQAPVDEARVREMAAALREAGWRKG